MNQAVSETPARTAAEEIIRTELIKHQRGPVYRDGRYHCRCKWISKIHPTLQQVIAHRAERITLALLEAGEL